MNAGRIASRRSYCVFGTTPVRFFSSQPRSPINARRALDFAEVAANLPALALRYRAILGPVLTDKDGAAYVGE